MTKYQEKFETILAWIAVAFLVLSLAWLINYAIGKPDDNIQPPKSQSFIVETPQGETYECWMFENTVQCDYPGAVDE